MKKTILARILGFVLMLAILAGLLLVTSPILMRKDSRDKHHEFYAYAEDYDVLFFGSSHMYNGVVPIDLWDAHGITAYNMGISGNRMGMTYWALRNALEYSSPKLIVVDCAYLLDRKASSTMSYNHTLLDDMRHLPTKISAVFDLFDTWEDRLRYLFPFSIYHNRWNEITADDFQTPSSKGKLGFSRLRTVTPVELPDFAAVTQPQMVDNVSTDYLRRIIEECQAAGIDVMLTYIPFCGTKSSLNDAAFIQTIADEYALHYLDAAELAASLNPQVDFGNNYDDNSHLNVAGAQRLSRIYGDFIAANYDLPDHRGEAAYDHWNSLSSSYHSDYRSILKRQEGVAAYLMALYHDGYSVLIEADEPQLLKSPVVRAALENLGADMTRITPSTDCILLGNLGRDSAYFEDFWSSPTASDTFLGHLSLGGDAKGNCILSLDKKTLATKSSFAAEEDSVTFYVLDSSTHKVLNTTTFSAADFLPEDVAQYLALHDQPLPEFASDLDACTDLEKIYILPDGRLYIYTIPESALPAITIESTPGGYWYANEGEPLGVFNAKEDCSAKRTGLIPVTPGDQLTYRGNAKYTPDSVIWLNKREHFISDEKYEAEDEAVIVTAPEKAAYVWFASFDYSPEDKVVLEVKWLTCQAVSSCVWTDTGLQLHPEE